jgi:hypothetical protein
MHKNLKICAVHSSFIVPSGLKFHYLLVHNLQVNSVTRQVAVRGEVLLYCISGHEYIKWEREKYIHVKIYNFLKQQILALEFQTQQNKNLYPTLSDTIIWSKCLNNESKYKSRITAPEMRSLRQMEKYTHIDHELNDIKKGPYLTKFLTQNRRIQHIDRMQRAYKTVGDLKSSIFWDIMSLTSNKLHILLSQKIALFMATAV